MSKKSISASDKQKFTNRFKSIVDDLERRLSSDSLVYINQNRNLYTAKKILIVSIVEQKLYFLHEQEIVKSYPISTAKAGIGNRSGSYQTPLGTHRITEKIGANADLGSIFKGRKNTRQIATIIHDPTIRSDTDNITTRILRLEGLEEGFNKGLDEDTNNVDSFSRYIYIHGTDEEGQLGKPASHGCVRMANQDIVELFDKVDVGQLVTIIKE